VGSQAAGIGAQLHRPSRGERLPWTGGHFLPPPGRLVVDWVPVPFEQRGCGMASDLPRRGIACRTGRQQGQKRPRRVHSPLQAPPGTSPCRAGFGHRAGAGSGQGPLRKLTCNQALTVSGELQRCCRIARFLERRMAARRAPALDPRPDQAQLSLQLGCVAAG